MHTLDDASTKNRAPLRLRLIASAERNRFMPIPAGAMKRIRAGLMASFEQNSSVSLASRSVDRKRNETTFCTSECHRPERPRSAVARTIDPDRDSIDDLKLIIIVIIVTIGAHYKSAGVGQTFNCY